MKNSLSAIILTAFILAGNFSFSQDVKLSRADSIKVKEGAAVFCDCYKKMIDSLHPFILEMTELMVLKGEKIATDTLQKRMKEAPGELAKVQQSIVLMTDESEDNIISKCDVEIKKEYGIFYSDIPEYNKNADALLVKYLAEIPRCKSVYYFYLIGKGEVK